MIKFADGYPSLQVRAYVECCAGTDGMAVNLDSSFLCASVEIGAIGRLLQYMSELALAEPREPSRLDIPMAAVSGAEHTCPGCPAGLWCSQVAFP